MLIEIEHYISLAPFPSEKSHCCILFKIPVLELKSVELTTFDPGCCESASY